METREEKRGFFHERYGVGAVCLTHDGRYAIAASAEFGETLGDFIRIWDTRSGRMEKEFQGHQGKITAVFVSEDNRRVLSAGTDRSLKLWDFRTGRCLTTIEGSPSGVRSAYLSRDGSWILSEGVDGTVCLWDVEGRCLRTYSGPADSVTGMAVSGDESLRALGARDRKVRVFEVYTGRLVREMIGHAAKVNSADFSRDGRYVVSGGGPMDNLLRIWEISSGRCLRTLTGHDREVSVVVFSPDGRYIMAGGQDKAVKIWGIDYRQPYFAPIMLCRAVAGSEAHGARAAFRRELARARGALDAGDVIKAGRHVRRARQQPGFERDSEALELWRRVGLKRPRIRLAGGWLLYTLEGHEGPIHAVTVSHDGRVLLSGGGDGIADAVGCDLKLWDVATGRLLRTFQGHERRVTAVGLSQDGKLAWSAAQDFSLRLWDARTGRCLNQVHSDEIQHFIRGGLLTADGRFALVGTDGPGPKMFDMHTGKLVRVFKGHKKSVRGMSLSPDERFLLTGSSDKTVKLWETATGRCIRTFSGHQFEVRCVSLSPDCRLALSGGGDFQTQNGDVILWDVGSGSRLRNLEGHQGRVWGVAVSPDSRYAITGAGDKLVKLWKIPSGRCIRTFQGHTGSINAVAFSPDGQSAFSGGADSTLKVWALDWIYDEKD